MFATLDFCETLCLVSLGTSKSVDATKTNLAVGQGSMWEVFFFFFFFFVLGIFELCCFIATGVEHGGWSMHEDLAKKGE